LSVYSPDVLLLNLDNLNNFDSEPLWEKESTVTDAASVPLVVEVVSTNWRDDYHKKFADYEEMGIPEFWIADYRGLGGKKFIGDPKQPTFSEVKEIVNSEFQWISRENDVLIRVENPEYGEFLLLNELQLRYKPIMPKRMRAYVGLAEEKYNLPVYPVLINILKEGEARGEARGEVRGEERGRREEKISSIEMLLEMKFGTQALQLMPEISQITNLEQLKTIQQAIKTVESLEELRQLF
jgi:hypothetical protein